MSRAMLHLDSVLGENLARSLESAADDLAEVVQGSVRRDRAGFQPGHVEQIGDEPVEPLGLVDDRGDQIRLRLLVQRVGHASKGPGRSEHGRKRRLEIVRDRGEQRGTQPIGLDRTLRPLHVLDQVHALDGERALVDQGVEQAALIGGEQRAGLVAVDADHPDRTAAGAHGQEQPLGAGKRIGTASGSAIVLPGPLGCGDIRVVEHVLRRITGLDGDRAVLRQQQYDPDIEHQSGLVGSRPQHVVERTDAGKLAAECVEQLERAHPPMRHDCLRAAARRKMRDDDGDQREEPECRDIDRLGDRERVDRRQEEEIVAQRAMRRWPTARAKVRNAPRPRPPPSGKRGRRSRYRSAPGSPRRYRARWRLPAAQRRRIRRRGTQSPPPCAPSSWERSPRRARRRQSRGH